MRRGASAAEAGALFIFAMCDQDQRSLFSGRFFPTIYFGLRDLTR